MTSNTQLAVFSSVSPVLLKGGPLPTNWQMSPPETRRNRRRSRRRSRPLPALDMKSSLRVSWRKSSPGDLPGEVPQLAPWKATENTGPLFKRKRIRRTQAIIFQGLILTSAEYPCVLNWIRLLKTMTTSGGTYQTTELSSFFVAVFLWAKWPSLINSAYTLEN